MLSETLLLLQRTDLHQADQRAAVIQAMEDVLLLFDTHANKEDEFVLAPLAAHHPALVQEFEAEHAEDHRLAHQLKEAVTALEHAADDEVLAQAAASLQYTFQEFVAFNLMHMRKEELVLNKALWSTFTDEEIRYAEQRLVASIPAHISALSATWMCRGLNVHDLAGWLRQVRTHAPREVFASLLAIAQRELPPARFESLSAALKPEAAIL